MLVVKYEPLTNVDNLDFKEICIVFIFIFSLSQEVTKILGPDPCSGP